MTEPTREAVVLVTDANQYRDVIEDLRRSATVTQQLPPRLALFLLTAQQSESIPNTSGAMFFVDDIPADILDGLSPQEQLFIQAWQARRSTKKRPGDQLPWDAPGYTPPG